MADAVIAYVTDLIFSTKIASTARSLGVDVQIVRSVEGLRGRLEAPGARLVIVDLNAAGDPLEAVRLSLACEPAPRVITYLSHVQADLAAAAKAAGAREVLARSAFSERLSQLLAMPAAPDSGSA